MSLTRRVPLKPGKGLKPSTKRMKQRRRAIGAPSAEQQAHQDAQRAKGCAMCLLLGLARDACGPVRVHHRTTGDLHGNKQLGQDATVALGDWHHQGVLKPELPTVAGMLAHYGPSLAHHKRAFLELIAAKLGERSTAALQRWMDSQLDPTA
jgi:hypothetical protein